MDQTRHNVFISYARADQTWVTAMVNLLVAGGAKVFMDVRDIAYGDNWEDVLKDKLREVERVLVFWSSNAAASRWVAEEYAIAIRHGKRLVPVPIDDTPLPETLARYHALTDLIPLLQQSMGKRPVPGSPPLAGPDMPPVPQPAPPKEASAGFGIWAVAAVAALLIVPAAFLFGDRDTSDAPVELAPGGPGTVTAPGPGMEPGLPWAWIIAGTALLGLSAWIVRGWLRQRRIKREIRDSIHRHVLPGALDEVATATRPGSLDASLGKQAVEMVFRQSDGARADTP